MSKDKMACDGGDVWAQRPHTGKEVVGGGASCSHSLALPQHRRQGIRTGPGQAKVCSWQIRPDPEVAVGILMDDLSTYLQYKPSTWVVNFYISLHEYYLLWAHLRSYNEIKQVSKPAVIFVDFLWLWCMWHIYINQELFFMSFATVPYALGTENFFLHGSSEKASQASFIHELPAQSLHKFVCSESF